MATTMDLPADAYTKRGCWLTNPDTGDRVQIPAGTTVEDLHATGHADWLDRMTNPDLWATPDRSGPDPAEQRRAQLAGASLGDQRGREPGEPSPVEAEVERAMVAGATADVASVVIPEHIKSVNDTVEWISQGTDSAARRARAVAAQIRENGAEKPRTTALEACADLAEAG